MKTLNLDPSGSRLRHANQNALTLWDALHGTVELSGDKDLVAGEPTILCFTFTCGQRVLPIGAQIGIAWRLPCDWGVPQWNHPEASDYVQATTPPGISMRLSFDATAGVKPWHHLFTATLHGRDLEPGEKVSFTFGESTGGSKGWRSQTAMAERTSFIAMVRSEQGEDWRRLRGIHQRMVLSGSPESLELLCPSACEVGKTFEMTVRMRDRWGNPSRGYRGNLSFENDDLELLTTQRKERWGVTLDVWTVTARLSQPGRYRLRLAAPEIGFSTEGNPIDCRLVANEIELYWGELHAGQCAIGCGQGSLDDFFWYAREIAALQFASHQANDVYVTKRDWDETRAVTDAHQAEGCFVTYLGCEWTTVPSIGGDRNVIYRQDEPELARAGRWFESAQPDSWPNVPTPEDLHRHLSGREAIVNLHAGGYTSNLAHWDPSVERFVEVHSTHGTSDWLMKEALLQGLKVGVTAGTDGITGRPGADHPGRRQTRNVRNGCLGTYSASNSRQGIWESLLARRTIATNGERIRLVVRAGEHWHGEEVSGSRPISLSIDIAGTAAIERVIIRRGVDIVATEEYWRPDPQHLHRFRVVWSGTRQRGTARDQAMDWSGQLSVDDGYMKITGCVGLGTYPDVANQGPARVIRWHSVSAGDLTGVEFEADPGAQIRFDSPPMRFAVRLAKMIDESWELPSDVGMGHARITRAPDPSGPRDVYLNFTDKDVPPGEHSYWVEVVQINGGRAWSSPIYYRLS